MLFEKEEILLPLPQYTTNVICTWKLEIKQTSDSKLLYSQGYHSRQMMVTQNSFRKNESE